MTEPTWRPGDFLVAMSGGPTRRQGFSYRGLGMWKAVNASPKGRRLAEWSLTHLGSGCRVAVIAAPMVEAFEIATKFAECGDWNFDGLLGYINLDPELPDKIRALVLSHRSCVTRTETGADNPEREVVVRQIAEARA